MTIFTRRVHRDVDSHFAEVDCILRTVVVELCDGPNRSAGSVLHAYPPAEARALAASLISAADYAEGISR